MKLSDGDLSRIRVENLQPSGSRDGYLATRTVGESLRVSASIFADGSDVISSLLKMRPCGTKEWIEIPMVFEEHDVAAAEFEIVELRPYEFTVCAWIDSYRTWLDLFKRKLSVGQEIVSELEVGAEFLSAQMGSVAKSDRKFVQESIDLFLDNDVLDYAVSRAQSEELARIIQAVQPRRCFVEQSPVETVWVAPAAARFGAWYEMFPRSAGSFAGKGASFVEAANRLPDIATMGFDVLYLAPIHPIGQTARKGPNNSYPAGPGDPGSPWAIGSKAGGHKAIHPELGTLEDFDFFLQEAKKWGLEIALDLAFHCSPDHPYVKDYPEWFNQRPDGTIRAAENPPFIYEDIYPLNFECKDWKALWLELKSIVVFWARRGVRFFRVDNPHTKPFGFWRWLMSEVRELYPDVVFLGEAFTRPNVMYALSKVGFTQSYTYFTWRNSAFEFKQYMHELTRTELRQFFRPNFFTNTHDVLPEALQFGGRPAFLNRAVLAATLSPSFGIYSGFELCENDAVANTVEYRHSEKYEIKPRNWNKPGNIKDVIRRLNFIRHSYSALQFFENIEFCDVDNESIIAFVKKAPDSGESLLVVVSFDPWERQGATVNLPLALFGLDDEAKVKATDVLNGGAYEWQGQYNYVELDPQVVPAHIFTIERTKPKKTTRAAPGEGKN